MGGFLLGTSKSVICYKSSFKQSDSHSEANNLSECWSECRYAVSATDATSQLGKRNAN